MAVPVFIFSLPRSGSTLLQRLLSAHEDVATSAEPWLLLPLFYGFRNKGIYTEYAQFGAHIAMQDLTKLLPDGKDDLYAAVRAYAMYIYSRLAEEKGASYFVDKTPRYHLIADEIIRAFPDARFIFLWRSPLAVVSSIVETWDGPYWTPFKYKIDLFKGLESLLRIYERHKDRVLAIRYERLLQAPEESMRTICEYIGLDFREEMLERLSNTRLQGRLGDPTGIRQYRQISSEPLHKWKRTICNPYRKLWCKRYLNWIGEHRMAVMGYSLSEELKALNDVPTSGKRILGDCIVQLYGIAYCVLEPRLYRDKLNSRWIDVVING